MVSAVAGDEFRSAGSWLNVLCAAAPSHALTSLTTVLFSLQERLHRVLLYAGLMALVQCALTVLLIPAVGPLGAAMGAAVGYLIGQVAYVYDQHRFYGVPGGALWAVWGTVATCSALQAMLGAAVLPRLGWALVSIGTIALVARTTGCVSPSLLERLFSGRLIGLGIVLRRTLTA
jgi:O-antigen/teichoic acid export membrane protein